MPRLTRNVHQLGVAEGRAPVSRTRSPCIAADLPGDGDSTVSPAASDRGRISKRTMGRALADVMSELGVSQFAVVGHDRGARVAYRLALDSPERIRAIAVLDVVPILDMEKQLTYEAARQMGHWFRLAQASTVPETLIGHDPVSTSVTSSISGVVPTSSNGGSRRIHPVHAQA